MALPRWAPMSLSLIRNVGVWCCAGLQGCALEPRGACSASWSESEMPTATLGSDFVHVTSYAGEGKLQSEWHFDNKIQRTREKRGGWFWKVCRTASSPHVTASLHQENYQNAPPGLGRRVVHLCSRSPPEECAPGRKRSSSVTLSASPCSGLWGPCIIHW